MQLTPRRPFYCTHFAFPPFHPRCLPSADPQTMDDDWDESVLREQSLVLHQMQQQGGPPPGKRSASTAFGPAGRCQGVARRRKTDSATAAARAARAAPAQRPPPPLAQRPPQQRPALDPRRAGGQASAARPVPGVSAQLSPSPKLAKAKSTPRRGGSNAGAGPATAARPQVPIAMTNTRSRDLIRVGTECSGMEPVAMALRNLGIVGHCSFEFCCDVDKWCKKFIFQNSPPKQFFDDIKLRDPLAAPPCDLYVAGFPCQPFSRAGLRQGTQDAKGRGTIFEYILAYLRAHRPRAIILENVAGLHDKVFEQTFNEMLDALRDIKGNAGQPHYIVSKRVVDTAKWGLPHSRKRVYIVCMAKDAINEAVPFRWPRPSAAIKPMDDLLQPIRGGDAELSALGPNCRNRLLAYLDKLRARGDNPDVDTWVINVFGQTPHGMKAQSPCLTRSRAGAGGHWVSSRSRLLTIEEMLSLQGMRADVCREGISNRQMGLMIGNAMSVNVLERLLVRLLPAVGLRPPGSLQDKWG